MALKNANATGRLCNTLSCRTYASEGSCRAALADEWNEFPIGLS